MVVAVAASEEVAAVSAVVEALVASAEAASVAEVPAEAGNQTPSLRPGDGIRHCLFYHPDFYW